MELQVWWMLERSERQKMTVVALASWILLSGKSEHGLSLESMKLLYNLP
jgi:hypothetical protein